MHTFCYIIQKQTASSTEMYNNPPNKASNYNSFLFHGIASKFEYINLTFSNQYLKSFKYLFAASPINYTIITKFVHLKSVLDNIFVEPVVKELFLDGFCSVQKVYHILNRFAFNYKKRNAPIRIQTDLLLNPISESQSNVITILQNGQKYLFTFADLTRIIESSIANTDAFFANPLAIKNPYNNIPFDKSILYYIYFSIKTRNYKLSSVFHEYFLCNFNLTKFLNDNEVLIRNRHIHFCATKGDIDKLYSTIFKMIDNSYFRNKIYIDRNFPKKELVAIMRPYLHLYYTGKYSLDMNARVNSIDELHKRLNMFYKFNPKFGKKHIIARTGLVTFNTKYIPFEKIPVFNNYDKSHLHIMQLNILQDDDASEEAEFEDEDDRDNDY